MLQHATQPVTLLAIANIVDEPIALRFESLGKAGKTDLAVLHPTCTVIAWHALSLLEWT